MLTKKDFEICVKLLENNEEHKILKRKFELLIEAENIKKESEDSMMRVNQELRKIFDEENENK